MRALGAGGGGGGKGGGMQNAEGKEAVEEVQYLR